jgi:CubicO group peptidase (beta-lactamase class C family)
MHSTAPDLACCLRMMLCGGTYAGCRILSAASARAMVTDQNSHLVRKPWGIGFGLAGSVDWNCKLITAFLQ